MGKCEESNLWNPTLHTQHSHKLQYETACRFVYLFIKERLLFLMTNSKNGMESHYEAISSSANSFPLLSKMLLIAEMEI